MILSRQRQWLAVLIAGFIVASCGRSTFTLRPADPHLPVLTSDRMEGFLHLYVDPEGWGPRGDGVLALDNIARVPVEVRVDGVALGQLAPLGIGRIREISAGIYRVTFQWPSGHVQEQEVVVH